MSNAESSGVVALDAGTRVPGRPFTDPTATSSDLSVLAAIRSAQVKHVERHGGGGTWVDSDHATHWLVTPRPGALHDPSPCLAVGFFGQARDGVDHSVIIRLEHAMLARADEIAGLLSYHNVQLANGRWGNLVLFAVGTDTAPMRSEPRHADAIRRAPAHYHSVRLHRGALPSGPAGEREIELETTLYLDFDVTPTWRAVRTA